MSEDTVTDKDTTMRVVSRVVQRDIGLDDSKDDGEKVEQQDRSVRSRLQLLLRTHEVIFVRRRS